MFQHSVGVYMKLMNIHELGGQSGAVIRDNDDATHNDGGRTNGRRQICYHQHSRPGSD